MSTDDKTISWYDDNADHYAAHSRNANHATFHSMYDKPVIDGLLPDLAGKRVLVLGCGPGDDAAYLKSRGADEVIGVDISKKLIAIASKDHPECQFRVMDAEKLDFEDASFDFVFASMLLHYLEDWTQIAREVYRVLQPGSSFLFMSGHPVNSALTAEGDGEGKKSRMLAEIQHTNDEQVEIIGDYLSRHTVVNPQMDVTTWHKSISEIATECLSAGFVISAIKEPQPLPEMKQFNPHRFAVLSKIPSLLVMKLEKGA